MKKLLLLAIGAALAILFGTPFLLGQSGTISPSPFLTELDNSGRIVNNGCIWTYTAGTTTPAATYTTNDTTATGTPNSNPIRSDSAGRFTAFLVPGQSYKFVYEAACTPPAHGTVYRTADGILAQSNSVATVDLTITAGETLTAGQCAYMSNGDDGHTPGLWFKCDTGAQYSSRDPLVGLVPSTILSGASGTLRMGGLVTGLTGLTTGALYYSGTAGSMTTSGVAVNSRVIGIAPSTTSLIVAEAPGQMGGANFSSGFVANGASSIIALNVPQGLTGGAFTFSQNANSTSTWTLQNTDTTNVASQVKLIATAGTASVVVQVANGTEGFVGTTTNHPFAIISHNTDAITVSTAQLVRFNAAAYGVGTATFDASGNITSVSDERQKDVQGFFAPGLAELRGIHPILYRYKPSTGLDTINTYAGFSAQNVLTAIPEAVGKNLSGVYSLNTIPIIAALVTSTQQLTDEIDELRAALGLPKKDRTPTVALDQARRLVDSARAQTGGR